jgi:hypothetical protein
MDNYFNDRLIERRDVSALTPAATVTATFGTNAASQIKNYTLILDQNTVLNVGGEIYNNQAIVIKITGNFTLSIIQATYTFQGSNMTSGVFTGYDGSKVNYLVIYCFDATNKIFFCNLITNSNA